MKTKTKTPEPAWVQATVVGTDIDVDVRVPTASLRRYLPLVDALVARAPADLAPSEKQALDKMVEGRTASEAVLTHGRGTATPDLVRPRLEVVSLVATATGMLAVARRAKVPALAARAEAVARRVFGDEAPVSRMTPQEAWAEVERIRAVVEGDAEARAALAGFVPAEVMEALFVANAVLGEALGLTACPAEVLPIGVREARVFLRRRIARYVRCIAASADEEDLMSVQRMQLALAPLVALSVEVSRKLRRARAPSEAAEVPTAEAGPPPLQISEFTQMTRMTANERKRTETPPLDGGSTQEIQNELPPSPTEPGPLAFIRGHWRHLREIRIRIRMGTPSRQAAKTRTRA